MARGIIRKPSLCKMVGAYRSQWKRSLCRLFLPGYGRRGMGWLRGPDKAWYNWWYNRTSVSLTRVFGCKPSRAGMLFALLIVSAFSLFAFPYDVASSGVKAHKASKHIKAREERESCERAERQARECEARERTERERQACECEARERTERERQAREREARERTERERSDAEPEATKQEVARAKRTPRRPTDQNRDSKRPADQSYIPKSIDYIPADSDVPTKTSLKGTESDESTPKTTPRNEGDRYVRKRMVISDLNLGAGDEKVTPSVGDGLEIVAALDENGKETVALVFQGKQIGCVAKQDRLALATALRLGRKLYGVISDVSGDCYEYEAWFLQNK